MLKQQQQRKGAEPKAAAAETAPLALPFAMPAGSVDLTDTAVMLDRIAHYNVAEPRTGLVELCSECDGEMLVNVAFRGLVRLTALVLRRHSRYNVASVTLCVNRATLDIDDVVRSLTWKSSALVWPDDSAMLVVALPAHLFSSCAHVGLYFTSTDETAGVAEVRLLGAPK